MECRAEGGRLQEHSRTLEPSPKERFDAVFGRLRRPGSVSQRKKRALIWTRVKVLIPRPIKGLVFRAVDFIAGSVTERLLGLLDSISVLKYIPFMVGRDYVVGKSVGDCQRCEHGLPIPPSEMRLYGESTEEHLEDGKKHWARMAEIIQTDGKAQFNHKRILELGCANARLMRHFIPFAKDCQIWGVDVDAKLIYWCRQFLSPPFHFLTTTTIPHLPFEDRSFDVVYAGSVFTHIDDLAEMWLMEVHRILAPGGLFYFTVQDQNTIRKMETTKEANWHALNEALIKIPLYLEKRNSEFGMMVIGRDFSSQVFYGLEYLKKFLGNIFDVVSIHEEAFGLQTGILVQKRAGE